jgi:hypothetical protein
LLDKILYDVDRAIDLYALGTDPDGEGEPEIRAAAYGFVIDQLIALADVGVERLCCFDAPAGCGPADRSGERLRTTLQRIRLELWWEDHPFDLFTLPRRPDITTPVHNPDGTTTNITGPPLLFNDADGNPFQVPGFAGVIFHDLGPALLGTNRVLAELQADPANTDRQFILPASLRAMRRIVQRMHQELCFQRDAELQWENLLQTVAPSCIRFNGVLTPVTELIERAIRAVTAAVEVACPAFRIDIPPHFETSLDSLADDVDRMGGGRPDEEDLEP